MIERNLSQSDPPRAGIILLRSGTARFAFLLILSRMKYSRKPRREFSRVSSGSRARNWPLASSSPRGWKPVTRWNFFEKAILHSWRWRFYVESAGGSLYLRFSTRHYAARLHVEADNLIPAGITEGAAESAGNMEISGEIAGSMENRSPLTEPARISLYRLIWKRGRKI